jgi:hypothetical protein
MLKQFCEKKTNSTFLQALAQMFYIFHIQP